MCSVVKVWLGKLPGRETVCAKQHHELRNVAKHGLRLLTAFG